MPEKERQVRQRQYGAIGIGLEDWNLSLRPSSKTKMNYRGSLTCIPAVPARGRPATSLLWLMALLGWGNGVNAETLG